MAAATNMAQKMEPARDKAYNGMHDDMPEITLDTSEDREYERAVSEAIDKITTPAGAYSPVGAGFSRGRLDVLVKAHCVDKISIGGDRQEYDLMDTFEPITETDEDGNERDLGGQSRVYLGYGQVPDETSPHGYRLIEYLAIAGYAGDPNTFMDSGEIQAEIYIKTQGLDRKIVAEVHDVDYITIEDNKVIPVTIMETVHGKELFEYMTSNKLKLSQRLEIFKRYVENIGEVHKAGYAHRDIKPNNVIVENDGNARVIDFGLAAKIGKPPKNSSVAGTPNYMSPEHMENRVDPRMDIYSLGCVLYEMLLGKPPYNHVVQKLHERPKESDDISPEQIRFQFAKNLYRAMNTDDHEHHRSPDLMDKRKRLSDNLGFIVDRCISRRPADRFQNCGALAKALDNVIAEQRDLEAIYNAVNEAMKKSDKDGGFEPGNSGKTHLTAEDSQLIALVGGLMAQAEKKRLEETTGTNYSGKRDPAPVPGATGTRKGKTQLFTTIRGNPQPVSYRDKTTKF